MSAVVSSDGCTLYWAPVGTTIYGATIKHASDAAAEAATVFPLSLEPVRFDFTLTAAEARMWWLLFGERPVVRARRLAVQRAMRARARRAARKGRVLR